MKCWRGRWRANWAGRVCWCWWRTTASRFCAAHRKLADAMLEPFSAVLENDRRLHELAALREAAEADRRSLLSRLGRQEMTETIVGGDSGLKLVMERVELVAKSDVPVLILGETGTGKEVIARAIHNRGAARRCAVHSRQLRSDSSRADRLAAIRPRARELYRRGRDAAGLV